MVTKMSIKLFLKHFELDDPQWGIVERAEQYKFLNLEYLKELNPVQIPGIAAKLCGDDALLRAQFEKGVTKLQDEGYRILFSIKEIKQEIDNES